MNDRLEEIFRQVFDIDDLDLTDETTAADVEGWDSLAHVTLMFSVEQEFGIQFAGEEFAALTDVGALRRMIEAKVAAHH